MYFEEVTQQYTPILAELYVKTFNAPPWNDKWTLPLATKRLDELILGLNSYGLICFDDNHSIIGMIIGYSETYYNCNQFYIRDFFIVPTLQGKGVGSKLLKELETQLTKKGVIKIYLLTSKEEHTELYYQRRGYNTWNNMVIMGKTLASL